MGKRTPRNRAAKRHMVVRGTGIPGNNAKPMRLTKLGIQQAAALAATGLSEQGVAATLGISRVAFSKAREAQPELALAFASGRAQLESHLAGNLVAQSDAGNVAATIFGLKNAGWSDGGRTGEAAPSLQVNINIPPAMSTEEFQEIVDGKTKTIDHKPRVDR